MVPEQKNFGWIKSSGLQQGRAPSNSGWCYLLEPLNKSIITWVEFQCFRISLMHFQIHRSALKLSITITCKAAAPTFTVELWRLVKLQILMLTHVDTLPMWRVYRTLASCRCRKFCLRACISRTEMYRNAIIICNYWLIISYILYIYYCILWLTYHINDHVLQMSWRWIRELQRRSGMLAFCCYTRQHDCRGWAWDHLGPSRKRSWNKGSDSEIDR